ncbi:hypothetical protein DACRYDRAFT_109011 [Dacryopinax primogenitus]|uniref:Uncharacterized protein n=1 Tax=Dacryopinax primogenitus (strain DJM 731) TaxID=1858805 RepID=M5FVF3_DACPD|nr:uncharacterized protein DACRYDRAFT_109011 [Dacryopinax primogenitus]EJU00264.1 hypothetical protein DACRYDRAFT_109011 [Dacryopinax primogenitus]
MATAGYASSSRAAYPEAQANIAPQGHVPRYPVLSSSLQNTMASPGHAPDPPAPHPNAQGYVMPPQSYRIPYSSVGDSTAPYLNAHGYMGSYATPPYPLPEWETAWQEEDEDVR